MTKWRSSYGVTISERGGLFSKEAIVMVRAFGSDSFLHPQSLTTKTHQNGENLACSTTGRELYLFADNPCALPAC